MGCQLPDLFRCVPGAGCDVRVELDFIGETVLGDDAVEVFYYFGAAGIERRPGFVLGEGEGVEDCWAGGVLEPCMPLQFELGKTGENRYRTETTA